MQVWIVLVFHAVDAVFDAEWKAVEYAKSKGPVVDIINKPLITVLS